MPIAQAMPTIAARPRLARPRAGRCPPAEPADAPILLSPPHLTGREIAGAHRHPAIRLGRPRRPGPRGLRSRARRGHRPAACARRRLRHGGAAPGLPLPRHRSRATRSGPPPSPLSPPSPRRCRWAPCRASSMSPGQLDARPRPAGARAGRAARRGRLPRAVVPVDLFGQSADLDAIRAACDRWGVPVLCDSAEALGATPARPPGRAGRAARRLQLQRQQDRHRRRRRGAGLGRCRR